MLIIPAIDLKDGEVVRFTRGKLNKKVYSLQPVEVALNWQKQGARYLHIVDLDGAMTGIQKNKNVIKKIIKAVKIPAQAGGGIRSIQAIEKMIEIGANRVVIGTQGIENMDFLEIAIRKFKEKIALGLDVSCGRIGLYGWNESSKTTLARLVSRLNKLKLKTIIYTDIYRDGTLKGMNIPAIKKMLESSHLDLIVSGGVSSLEDIRKLAKLDYPNLKGVIVGKALYENMFSIKEAIAAADTRHPLRSQDSEDRKWSNRPPACPVGRQ